MKGWGWDIYFASVCRWKVEGGMFTLQVCAVERFRVGHLLCRCVLLKGWGWDNYFAGVCCWKVEGGTITLQVCAVERLRVGRLLCRCVLLKGWGWDVFFASVCCWKVEGGTFTLQVCAVERLRVGCLLQVCAVERFRVVHMQEVVIRWMPSTEGQQQQQCPQHREPKGVQCPWMRHWLSVLDIPHLLLLSLVSDIVHAYFWDLTMSGLTCT